MANYKQSDYEALRRRCVELRQAGWKQNAIAQAFGLTQGWVSRTLTKYNLQGASALQEGKRTGAPARLSSEQLAELVNQLNNGPEFHGFQGAIWTRPRVNEVIKTCFGVSYDPSQVGRLLKKSAGVDRNHRPKPASKMPKPSLSGGRNAYPSLKKAHTEGRVIIYVDEAACYLLPLLAHTWAPCGQTPMLIEQAGRAHLSLIAAIAPNGRLYIAGQDRPFNSEDIIWFLGKLCHRYRKRDLLVIWDGAAIHRSQVVKSQLSRKLRRVHLERLPAYSPELNPVELLWSNLKQSLKNQAFTTLEQLQVAVLNQLERLHGDPKLVTSFFRKQEIAFFTD